MLQKMSVGVIYAVKLGESDKVKAIASFMSKYTDTPIEYYTPSIVQCILINTITDLLNNMKSPGSYFSEYQRLKVYPWDMSDFDAMCAALATVQVKEKNPIDNTYQYINGFWDIGDFND